MRRSWYRSAASAIVVGALVALAGCGSITDDDLSAPAGSTITFVTGDTTIDAGGAACPVATAIFIDYHAVVQNAEKLPLNDVQVVFELNLPFMSFVDGANNVIGLDPLTGQSRIVKQTDDHGVAVVRVAIPTCVGADDLWAFSGTASAKVHVTVN